MSRETAKIKAENFTTPAALVREVVRLLHDEEFKLEIVLSVGDQAVIDRLSAELEGVTLLGRVKVVKVRD